MNRGRGGFTIIELAVVVCVIAGLFAIATFREGAIIGTGVFFGGLCLCAAMAAGKKGLRLVSAAFVISSITAFSWMTRACTASFQDHAAMRRLADETGR